MDRQAVHDFLVSRRGRIRPEQAGMPTFAKKRRASRGCGVRRSPRWQGWVSTITPDSNVAICRGSRTRFWKRWRGLCSWMRQSGSTYLFDLARSASAPASRRRRTKPAVTRVRPSLLGDLNGMTGTPAYVRNARLDILAVNDLCLALFDGVLTRDALPFNLARFVFLDPYAKAFYLDWDTIARDMVSSLRSRVGQDPSDRGLSDLIGELTTRSESFAQLWARHDVRLHRTSRKRLATRIVGATKPHHLSDAVAALDIDLTDDEVSALEQPYGPRLPTYF